MFSRQVSVSDVKCISVLGKEIDSEFPFYSFIQCNFLELSEALFVNNTLDRCGVSSDKHMYFNKSSYCPFESQLQGKVALYCNERRLYMFKVSVNKNFSTLLDFVFFGFLA